MFLKVPSSPNHSMGIWFYGRKKWNSRMQIVFNAWLDTAVSLSPVPCFEVPVWPCCLTLATLFFTLLYLLPYLLLCVTGLEQALLAILQFTWTILLLCNIIPKKIQEVVAQELSFKIRLIVRKNWKMNSPPNITISLHLQYNWMTHANKWNILYYLIVQIWFNTWFVC